jgi:hypothetical protein
LPQQHEQNEDGGDPAMHERQFIGSAWQSLLLRFLQGANRCSPSTEHSIRRARGPGR